MLEGGRISSRQLILLIFTSRIIIGITSLPVLVAPPANQDVWTSILFAFPIDLFLAGPVYLLSKRFPNQTFYEYSQTILGNTGRWVGILYVYFFLHCAATCLSQFSEFFTTSVMPETPYLYFVITLTLISAYAVRQGIEVLGRLSELIAPLIMLGIIGIALLLAKDMDLKMLTPVLEKGILPSLFGGLYVSTLMVEILGFAILLPFLNDPQKTKRVFIYSIFLITLFGWIIAFSVLTIFGAELAKNLTFPFYSAVRVVNVGDFLERLESVHVATWILGMFIKASLSYYLAVLGLAQLFRLKDYKPLILPMGTLIIPLAIIIGTNIIELRKFTSYKIFTWFSLFFIFIIPSALYLTAIIRKKGEKP